MPTRSNAGISHRLKSACLLACSFACIAGAQMAHAETIGQALAAAYQNNPQIRGEQARLRATDETLAQAQSGYRPTVSAGFDYSLTIVSE